MSRKVATILALVLVALAVLLVAADTGLRSLSQFYVSRSIQRSLDLNERPSVSLSGFPFSVRLFSGDLPSVTVRARDVTADGVRLDRVDLTLRGVDISAAKVLSTTPGSIHAKSGDGTATITAEAISQALAEQSVPVTVRFEGGKAAVSSSELPGEVQATVSIENGALVLRPDLTGIALSFSLTLPQVVEGITYTAVHIDGSIATLSFTLTNTDFALPG